VNASHAIAPSLLVVLVACGASRPAEVLEGHGPRPDASTIAAAQRVLGRPLVGAAPPLDHESCSASSPSPPSHEPSPDGSTVALTTRQARTLAYVADSDAGAIQTIDVDTGAVVGSTRLGGAPQQLVVLPDGRVVVATEQTGRLEVLAPREDGGLARLCTRRVGPAPWGLAWDDGGARLVVTDASGAALEIVRTDTMKLERTFAIAKAPRAVIVRDGTAFISHLSGSTVSTVALDAKTDSQRVKLVTTKASPQGTTAELAARRSAGQSFALASVDLGSTRPRRRILVPSVSVDPGDELRPSETYYGDPPGAVPKQAPHVVAIDADTKAPLSTYVLDPSRTAFVDECLLPRAAAVDPRVQGLFVACMGIDQVLELDARAHDPMLSVRRRFAVPSGPTGVVLEPTRLVVWSQHDGALSIIPLEGAEPRRSVEVPRPALDPTWQLGRKLFFATDDTRLTSDGLTCASCHPDGLEDGLTWRTPEGPRQTPMLAGRVVGTEPYGWSRDQDTLRGYVADTIQRLGGAGLSDEALAALVVYVESLPAPASGAAAPAEELAAGRAIFEAPKTDCATCHPGGGADGTRHMLDFHAKETLDTPSLRSIGLTAPYFHDGRYATLDALLSDPKSHMGRAHALDPDERRLLRRYLESL
jgi:DNA-binding beta-propeller fold protein YncE